MVEGDAGARTGADWNLSGLWPDRPGPDLVAGLTVAAMLVPQAMAYALLAGLPPEVGLYASTVPLVLYALLGTSPHLAVGPVAIVSLLTATSVARTADATGADPVAVAAVLALLVGGLYLLLGLVRAGLLVRLLSHPVLVGFTAAAAVIIGVSQVRHLLGVDVGRSESVTASVIALLGALGEVHLPTLAVAAVSIALLVGFRRWWTSLPGALVVVVAATAASAGFDLADHGVAVVGAIPRGLPPLSLPTVASPTVLGGLLPAAAVITLVGFMESIAVAKVYARQARTRLDPDRELLALGAANVGAGLFGGYPVTGGFSRTAVQADAGARSRLTGLVVAVVVAMVTFAFTPLLTALPTATLGAIVVVAVAGLVDVGEVRHVASLRRSDFLTLVVAVVATLVLGVERGIGVAVVASLVIVTWRIMSPHTAVLGRLPGGDVYRNVDRFPEAILTPGVEVIRFDMSLNYLNVEFARRRVRRLVREADPPPWAVVLDASGVNDVDVSAIEGLVDLLDELEDAGVQLHLADVKGPVRDVFRRSGLDERLAGCMHRELPHALAALEEAPAGSNGFPDPVPRGRRAPG